MTAAPWPAPAKLNLFLHVTGRRADGYHEIQTVFQLVDLADQLRFEPRADGEIRRLARSRRSPGGRGPVPGAPRGSCRRRTARPLGAAIRLEKRIPVQGGLGGGSSDAATTLVALNEIWGVAPAGRCARGNRPRSRVPTCRFSSAGRAPGARGSGERLTPLELPARHFAIVFPGIGISTAEVFQAPELTRKTPETTIRGFLKAGGRNDCEPVVTGRSPEVRRALAWLAERGKAQMTGTGSCVFAAFADRESAQAALEGLPPGWRGFVARGLDRSPLQERLAAERSRVSGKV